MYRIVTFRRRRAVDISSFIFIDKIIIKGGWFDKVAVKGKGDHCLYNLTCLILYASQMCLKFE